jgi:CRP/FNR family transcriptional regulator, cyclic AMP receptor protein
MSTMETDGYRRVGGVNLTNPEFLLKQVPLFRSLPPEDCRRIAALLQKRFLRKGEVLIQRGAEGTALYMIVTGKLKVSRRSPDGVEMILAILGGGDFCGEMALLDGAPRSADVVAVEETLLYDLNRKEFLAYVMNNETAVRGILSALSRRLRKADDLLEDVFFLNVSPRLAKKLIDLAEMNGYKPGQTAPVKLSVKQKDLAGMVGASRESVNKELRSLREKELISISGKTIMIYDVEALRLRIG